MAYGQVTFENKNKQKYTCLQSLPDLLPLNIIFVHMMVENTGNSNLWNIKRNLRHLRLTKSDLKVGVGGPGCGDGAILPGRPDSGLLVTRRRGFGGGKNVGGNGGASELIEPSEDAMVLVQSLALLKFCD